MKNLETASDKQPTLHNANSMQNMGTASFRAASQAQWRVSLPRIAGQA